MTCKVALDKKDPFKHCLPCYGKLLFGSPTPSIAQQWFAYYQSFLTHTKAAYTRIHLTDTQLIQAKKMVEQELKNNPEKYPNFKSYNPTLYNLPC